MAILENGAAGFAFTSGQAANMAVFDYLKQGEHVILCDDIYGGTFRICEEIFRKFNCTFTYVDMTDAENVRKALQPNTKMIFLETPTNPMMKVADIQEIAKIAHENDCVFVVDNTFLTPYFQRPLDLGADIVVHSGTKYLSGHNDTLAGIVVVKDPEMAPFFEGEIKSMGAQLGPFDCWLVLRGLKTLSLRMRQHNENAYKVAHWLKTQPKVKKVYYAGFEDHINYEVSRKQSTGFGGMISFELDSEETAQKLLSNVNMILFAESLGGTESLVTYPWTQTHESIPEDTKMALGITKSFIRISIGIENVDDIIADLDQAMNR